MTDPEPEYDARYIEGIKLFNDCDFFEAHDVWEELWADLRGNDNSRKYYQGLIQVAVCLHHFVNGNIRGAKKLFDSSTNYLRPYAPRYANVDVDRLLKELEHCCEEILASTEEFPKIDIDPDKIPDIHFG